MGYLKVGPFDIFFHFWRFFLPRVAMQSFATACYQQNVNNIRYETGLYAVPTFRILHLTFVAVKRNVDEGILGERQLTWGEKEDCEVCIFIGWPWLQLLDWLGWSVLWVKTWFSSILQVSRFVVWIRAMDILRGVSCCDNEFTEQMEDWVIDIQYVFVELTAWQSGRMLCAVQKHSNGGECGYLAI